MGIPIPGKDGLYIETGPSGRTCSTACPRVAWCACADVSIHVIQTRPIVRTGVAGALVYVCKEHYDEVIMGAMHRVSNHQPPDCLLNRLFRRRSKKTPKLHVIGLCAGNSPGTSNKWPVTRKMAPFADVIMKLKILT